MSATRLSLDEQLCFALYAATNAVTRAYRPVLREIGITYPQYLVMIVLWEEGARTVRGIAERLSLPANAITPLIDRLATAGLVVRERDAEDRRVVHIVPTETGLALEERAAAARAEVVCQIAMSDSAMGALRSELRELVGRLESTRSVAPASRKSASAHTGVYRTL